MAVTKIAVGLGIVAFLVSASAAPRLPKERSGRLERCNQLQRQLDQAIASNAASRDVGTADRLRKRAIYLCRHRKESKGARAFAKALVIFGLKPVDPPPQKSNRKP